MVKLQNFTAREAFEAAGVSRGEVGEWTRKGYLHIPPENPAGRAGRRYSVANVIELAMLKALISYGEINVSHGEASRVTFSRFSKLLDFKDQWAADLGALNEPYALWGSEFDPGASEYPIHWIIHAFGRCESTWRPLRHPLELKHEVINAMNLSHKVVIFDVTHFTRDALLKLTGSRDPFRTFGRPESFDSIDYMRQPNQSDVEPQREPQPIRKIS